jgi:hypothetical protein
VPRVDAHVADLQVVGSTPVHLDHLLRLLLLGELRLIGDGARL